jgi:hypothetical protein
MMRSRPTQRRVLWGLIGIIVSFLIYLFGIHPIIGATKKAEEEILVKKDLLHRYEAYLRNRKMVEEELAQTIKLYETVQLKLLTGETPQLVAANLQEIVKRLSEKNGIGIRSFRILEPKEINSYQKISIQIDFNPTNSMLGLGQFIHDIEHYEKDLMISEMELLVPNMRMPSNIQGNLVISGLMKGTKSKEKVRGTK